MARIGVEPSLTNVKDALTDMGHEVVDLHNEEDATNCDYAVISGVDENMMGILPKDLSSMLKELQPMKYVKWLKTDYNKLSHKVVLDVDPGQPFLYCYYIYL